MDLNFLRNVLKHLYMSFTCRILESSWVEYTTSTALKWWTSNTFRHASLMKLCDFCLTVPFSPFRSFLVKTQIIKISNLNLLIYLSEQSTLIMITWSHVFPQKPACIIFTRTKNSLALRLAFKNRGKEAKKKFLSPHQ